MIQNIIVKSDAGIPKTVNFDDSDIKDLQKRLADLEKTFKVFSKEINIEYINKELIRLSECLETKASIKDLADLRDLYSKISSFL